MQAAQSYETCYQNTLRNHSKLLAGPSNEGYRIP